MKATFGAGCFWGVEAAYRQIPGVLSTAVGYLGGTLENPTYHDVCSGVCGRGTEYRDTRNHTVGGLRAETEVGEVREDIVDTIE